MDKKLSVELINILTELDKRCPPVLISTDKACVQHVLFFLHGHWFILSDGSSLGGAFPIVIGIAAPCYLDHKLVTCAFHQVGTGYSAQQIMEASNELLKEDMQDMFGIWSKDNGVHDNVLILRQLNWMRFREVLPSLRNGGLQSSSC